MKYLFAVDRKYTRKDIFRIIGVPEETKGGTWFTGYHKFEGDWFIFANVGIPGRTGHDYENQFIGDDFKWFGKTHSNLHQLSIQSMLKPEGDIFIFTRSQEKEPFNYEGNARVKEVKDTTPVEVLWTFNQGTEFNPSRLSEEIVSPELLKEGAKKVIVVNSYERNPKARRICIEHYGATCVVCQFNFEKHFGALGAGFIHVHHVKPLNEISEEYDVDPIKDLRPVCPNCHAMIHKKVPAFNVEEIREIWSRSNS